MNIGQYIAEILEERGKVSVQGVGTFYLKKNDAYFDEDRQMFFPKDQKLSFKLFEEDNSIFPEYISKAANIPVDVANQAIKKFAIKFSTELGRSGTAEVSGIGKLKKEGPEYTIETFSLYGLIPLPESGLILSEETDTSDFFEDDSIPEDTNNPKGETIFHERINPQQQSAPKSVPQEKIIPKEESAGKKESTSTPDYEDLFRNVGGSENRVDIDTANEAVEDKTSSGKWKWVLISLAVLSLIAAVLGYLFYPKLKELVQQYRSTSTQTVEQVPVIPTPITPIPTDSLADSVLTKQKDSIIAAAKTAPVTKPDSVKNGTVTYEIIVGSFTLKREAETFVSQWTAKGAKVHIIERPLRTFKYKVSAGSFKDQASAQNELPLVQKNINKEAWIDQMKN